MSKSGTKGKDYFYAWKEFKRCCGAHPISDLDCLYALPLPLIDRIAEVVPNFWSPEQKEFEEDLSSTSGGKPRKAETL